MTKYQFQKKILLRSIFIMLILFIILSVVFSGYVIKTQTIEFEDQVDTQLQGITSQIDNTLQLADDIALQIAANFQIIDVFNKLQGYHGKKNYFVEKTDIDYAVKQHLISYMLKQNFLKRISLFDANQDLTYVGSAVDNGKDAIQYLKEYPVDVMFVDMNLPIVSGKELLKFCYSEKLPVLPVVLSGYTDFEYVKCAVANHAVDYLLKPLNSQELKLILQKIEIRIREQQQEEKIQNLTDAIKGFNTLQTKESNSEKNPSYSMLLISLGACPYENERNYRELFEKLDLEGNFSQIVSEENFWLVNGKNINEKIIFVRRDQVPDINHLNQFVRSLKFLGLTITIVFYKDAVKVSDIFATYHLLQKYARKHVIFLKNSVLIYSPEGFKSDYTDLRRKIDCMILQCKNMNISDITDSFAELLKLLTVRPITQKEAVRNIKYFVSELYKVHHGHREFFEVEEDIQFILENYYTKEEILKEFDFLLKDIFGIEVYDSRDKKIIALKMKNYLDEKFRSNVTNQLLAANFGFVPSYLVSIFKICYGLTPMDYLVNKRIDEAKVLLEDGSLKIKDIARVVGYEDSLYFSKVFKKFTGVSPKEYKGDGV